MSHNNSHDTADDSTELQKQVSKLKKENKQLKQRVSRLNRETEKLRQTPLFIATVNGLLDNNEVTIEQHGNEQQALTEVTDEQYSELEVNDRVAIDNSFNIVKVLDDETSRRAKVLQVDSKPEVTYNDIGGLTDEIDEVRETIEKPLTDPEIFETIGIDPPNGILLHGPPGTGKTMLAKAVANKTDSTFLKLAGSDLAQKFIGEGAKMVREIFETAAEEDAAIIFIDEIDAIAAKRTDSKTSGDAEVQRTLIQLLNEMDGFEDRKNVSIIAATNRIDMLDEAILRPGRFDRQIEIDEPDVNARKEVFDVHTRDMNIANTVSTQSLAEMTDGMTGAEIKSICMEAGMFCIRDDRTEITMSDFEDAYEKITDETTISPGMQTQRRDAFA